MQIVLNIDESLLNETLALTHRPTQVTLSIAVTFKATLRAIDQVRSL